MQKRQDLQVSKSPGDKNDYDLFELPNKLQVLLIENNNKPESQGEAIAFASLAVNAGSFNDPVGGYGMAHFLEHMVFMGSQNYPDPGSYSNHVAANGGYTNAYTEFEWTNFHFEVTYSGLQVALDMMADNLGSPLLLKSEIEKEITAIESEFSAITVDDNVRQILMLMGECHSKDHIFNTFPFGNLKSLNAVGDYDRLRKSVQHFYQTQYSADRMKLVVQVKTKDKMAEVKKWVTESFSKIKNRNLGKQNFSKQSRSGPKSPSCGTMPFEGRAHEILCCDSVTESNILGLFWTLPHDAFAFDRKQSLSLILSLISNQSEGSLLSCLKKLNFASDLTLDDVPSFKTCFRLINLEIVLTDEGMQNYRKVLALVFEYKNKIEREWLAQGKALNIWKEEQMVSNLKYEVYSSRPADEHLLEISQAMIWCDDLSQVIKKTQESTIIEGIDVNEIRMILSEMKFDNCKIALCGNDLIETMTSSEDWAQIGIGQNLKEEWLGTKYIKVDKQNLQSYIDLFDDSEWEELRVSLKEPPKNRFLPDIPQGLKIISQSSTNENKQPTQITLAPSVTLYTVLDSVYRKPETALHLTLRMKQPDQPFNSEGRPTTFLQTPADFAMFAIAEECFKSQINTKIGYEASLANLQFETSLVDGSAIAIKINGFSQKIFEFAALFIDQLLDSAENGFDSSEVEGSILKLKEEYQPEQQITYHTLKNMNLFMRPFQYHDSCIEKELEKFSQMDEEEQVQIKPHEFLKNRVLANIQSIQVLVVGNTPQNQAEKFCRDHIINKFKISSTQKEAGQRSTCLSSANKHAEALSEATVKALKNTSDDEISPQDKKMFDLIQKGVVTQIYWDCVTNEAAEDEYGEEAGEEGQEQQEAEEMEEGQEQDSGAADLNEKQPEQPQVEKVDQENEAEAEGDQEEDQKEDEEEQCEEEEISSGCSVEIFFQAKQLNDIRTACFMEIFASILSEKMFDQLRTKEDLCYKCGCEYKDYLGVAGITLYIQSEKVNPDYLVLRVLDFVDNFYFSTFDQALYDQYKKGVTERKKGSCPSIEQEAERLNKLISEWSLDTHSKIDWDHKQKVIACMEEKCSFDAAKEFYRELFTPYKREPVKYTPEQIEKLTELDLLRNNPYIGLQSVVVYISNNNISFDDTEAIQKILMQDVLTEVENYFGQKTYLCLRVFQKNQEGQIRWRTLENLAQAGKQLPSPGLVTSYMTKPETQTIPINSIGGSGEQRVQDTARSPIDDSLDLKLKQLESEIRREKNEKQYFKTQTSQYKQENTRLRTDLKSRDNTITGLRIGLDNQLRKIAEKERSMTMQIQNEFHYAQKIRNDYYALRNKGAKSSSIYNTRALSPKFQHVDTQESQKSGSRLKKTATAPHETYLYQPSSSSGIKSKSTTSPIQASMTIEHTAKINNCKQPFKEQQKLVVQGNMGIDSLSQRNGMPTRQKVSRTITYDIPRK